MTPHTETPASSRFESIAPDELRRRVSRLKKLPTLPLLQQSIAQALADPEIDFEQIAELIETDQSLTSQILRLANSAFYGAQGAISSVVQALVVLGATVTRSLVLSSSVFDLDHIGLRGFWEHSIGCAVAAGAIAKVTGVGNVEEVTAAGLLHDLGKVVLFHELPEAFEHIAMVARRDGRCFREVELEVLGLDHGEIGGLVEKWNFPPCLAEPIMFHHTPQQASRAGDEVAIVHVANAVVHGLGYGASGHSRIPEIDPGAWAQLKLTPGRLFEVLEVYDLDLEHALNHAILD